MVKRRVAGYSLLEVVVAMAVFGVFLLILGTLTVEMRRQEKRMPVNFLRHPQIAVVVSKLRRDVLDAFGGEPYPKEFRGYTQTPKTLIVQSLQESGGLQTIIWDFRTPGEVHRHAYNFGVATDWTARGLPEDISALDIGAIGLKGEKTWAVRITAQDSNGRTAIDQVFQPRACE